MPTGDWHFAGRQLARENRLGRMRTSAGRADTCRHVRAGRGPLARRGGGRGGCEAAAAVAPPQEAGWRRAEGPVLPLGAMEHRPFCCSVKGFVKMLRLVSAAAGGGRRARCSGAVTGVT